MAGRGPAPKDPAKRVRRNKDVVPMRVVEAVPEPKPELPEFNVAVEHDGEIIYERFEWPKATREFWAMLDHHPLKSEFTAMDWSYLLDTARLHAAFWSGNVKLAPELRLREAKYGFTPEDRARLRLQWAQATGAEEETKKKVSASRQRAAGVRRATS